MENILTKTDFDFYYHKIDNIFLSTKYALFTNENIYKKNATKRN